VKDENELRQKHEENSKIIIDNYLVNNPIRAEDEESVIKQFTEDLDKNFRSVLVTLLFLLRSIGENQCQYLLTYHILQ
jgi:hypothetical protein